MKKNKRLITLILVISMLLQLAPIIVVEAAENVYDLIINPKTPLDEVYFYSNETGSENKGYYYGFVDGKVSVMDEDYNLIKKTDFDMINRSELVMIKGMPAFTASKNVNGKYLYGIVSFEGEIIVEPEYSDILINTEDSLIYLMKEEDGKFLHGLWDLECNEILPCEYLSIELWDNRQIIKTVNIDETHSVILNGKKIWTGDAPEKDYYYSCYFSEFEGQKCIKINLHLDSLDEWAGVENKGKIVLITYDGEVIKEFSSSEWKDYEKEHNTSFQDRYEVVCKEWLNDESEKAKQHVIDFFKTKGIELSNIKVFTAIDDTAYEDYSILNDLYYWVIITAEYPKSGKYQNDYDEGLTTNTLTYTYIYDENKNCIISGRSFEKIKISEQHYIYSFYNNKNMYRYLLSDEGKMFYFDIDTKQVKELFEVDDTILTYVRKYDIEEWADKEIHQLYYYQSGIIGDCFDDNDDRKEVKYVYINGKGHLYNSIGDYCFIKNDISGTDFYFFNDDYDKKRWELYTHTDISIDEVKKADKIVYENYICLSDKKGQIIFIGQEDNFKISYNIQDIPETSEIYNIIGNKDCQLIIFKENNIYQYCYSNVISGEFFKLPVDSKLSLQGIIETDGKLYTWTRTNIIVIDKETLKTDIITPYENFGKEIELNNSKEIKEYISALFLLDGEVNIKYRTVYNDDDDFYGIMNLSGEKVMPSMKDDYSGNKELYILGNYIIIGSDVYDSSFHLLTNNGKYSRYFGEDGLAVLYDNDKSSNFTPKLISLKTGNDIYDFVNGENILYMDYVTDTLIHDIKKINKYYAMYFNINSEKKVMLINSLTDKVEFYGKAFVHKNDNKQKVIVFGEPESISLPTPKPSKKPKPDVNTPTPTFLLTPTPIPTSSVCPSVTPSGENTAINGSGLISGGGVATVYTEAPASSQTPAPTQTVVSVTTSTPNITSMPNETNMPVVTLVPDTTAMPTIIPEVSAKPSITPSPSVSSNTETVNKVDSEENIKKGLKITDKKTKSVYKIKSTKKNKKVEYVNSTKKNIKNVTIPASIKLKGKTFKVVSIGKDAFKNNEKLKSVKIGKNVKTIGSEAFSGCKKLQDVKMGKNITSIEASAFNNCNSLTKITIPAKVNKIGTKAFNKCNKLQYILVKTKKLTINNVGKDAFGNGYANPRVKSDKSVWKQYQDIFTSKGLSNKALFIINPVKLVI